MIRYKFPVFKQLDQMDCGPTCLRMVAAYHGRHYSLETLRNHSLYSREGVSLRGISEAADKIGFQTQGTRVTIGQLVADAPLPCILHWNQNHFVVFPPQKVTPKSRKLWIADPVHGLIKMDKHAFLNAWLNNSAETGIALLLEPRADFFVHDGEQRANGGLGFLINYLKPYKKYIFQLLLGMLLASLFTLIFPFLTQSLVDVGINLKNVNFIYLVLGAQLTIFLGNIAIEVVRGWLLLHISGRVNITIISDFLVKLMKLPISFFDTKMVGDINQRIADHQKIENFLSITTLNTLFSVVNLSVFSLVLLSYGWAIFLTFIIGSLISIYWILFFLKKRRELDYARFLQNADNQNRLFEIITGIQEIKLNGGELSHRLSWERIQSRLFEIRTKGLVVSQYQTIGSSFFNQLKNILISYITAREVIEGHISLGMMLSVSYIIGQANSPIDQLLTFFQTYQDAKISVERLKEIHQEEEEERAGQLQPQEELYAVTDQINEQDVAGQMAAGGGFLIKNVSFAYKGPAPVLVLNQINLHIPFGKTTAIVGASGSGKTTLVKLLLKYYEPRAGEIYLGKTPFAKVSPKWWWQHCGVVMSDGYIFSGTIEQNIAVSEPIDHERLSLAIKLANIQGFIDELPLGVKTKIGQVGNGISSGQRQRIMIARAIYKQPQFLFLDEATSTLDANNERRIIENLEEFFIGRTVVVVAHRLSTVKHADQIVVMKNGMITEIGTHYSLIEAQGEYYTLVKNQLELGK